jgi:Ulp1 family protease
LPFELFYPLEEMEERHIKDVFYGTTADDDEIVNTLFENEQTKMAITKKSLRTCQGQSWINDEVINYYLSLLRLRDRELASYNSNHCKCYFFTTYYYSNKVEPLVRNKFGDMQTERIKRCIEKQNAI